MAGCHDFQDNRYSRKSPFAELRSPIGDADENTTPDGTAGYLCIANRGTSFHRNNMEATETPAERYRPRSPARFHGIFPVKRATAFGGHMYVKYNTPWGAILTTQNDKLGAFSILLGARLYRRCPSAIHSRITIKQQDRDIRLMNNLAGE